MMTEVVSNGAGLCTCSGTSGDHSQELNKSLREHGGRSDLAPSQVSVLLRLEKDGPCSGIELGSSRRYAPSVHERHHHLVTGSRIGEWLSGPKRRTADLDVTIPEMPGVF